MSNDNLKFLYILSEADNDAEFYRKSVERITGCKFQVMPYRKPRKNGGISSVMRLLPSLLKIIKRTGKVDDTYFLIAVDNDRRPIHPKHAQVPNPHKLPQKDGTGACRFCEIERIVSEAMSDRENWPIKGAIAVPVQMLESWLLLICNRERYQNESGLPIFARSNTRPAKDYYRPKKPPAQLKELLNEERERLQFNSNREFFGYCADNLIPETLGDASKSFHLFMEQVAGWFEGRMNQTEYQRG